MDNIRIPKSWILLAVFIVSVMGAGALVFTTPPNYISNQTGDYFGDYHQDSKNVTADNFSVMNYFNTIVGTYIDSYSCAGDFCVYVPWYDTSHTYVKNMQTGKIDFVESYINSDSTIAIEDVALPHNSNRVIYVMGTKARPIIWKPTGNLVPSNTTFIGLNRYFFTIQSDDVNNNHIGVDSGVVIVEASIYDSTYTGRTSVNIPRPFHVFYNTGNAPVTLTSWYNTNTILEAGYEGDAAAGVERNGIAVNVNGRGDAFWGGVTNEGIGFNSFVDQGNVTSTGQGIHIENYGAGYGQYILNNGTGIGLNILSNNSNNNALNVDVRNSASKYAEYISANGSNAAIEIEDFNGKPGFEVKGSNTSIDKAVSVLTSKATSGTMINLYQDTSSYSGTGIAMNLGASGTYSGRYMDVYVKNYLNYSITNKANISLTHTNSCITMYSGDGTAYMFQISNGGTTSVTAGTCS